MYHLALISVCVCVSSGRTNQRPEQIHGPEVMHQETQET